MNHIAFEYPDREVLMYGECAVCLGADEIKQMIQELRAARIQGRKWIIIRVQMSGRTTDGRCIEDGNAPTK